MKDAEEVFTLAMSSNLPKSLLRTTTSSSGVQVLARLVKPTMSAYKMLKKNIAYLFQLFV